MLYIPKSLANLISLAKLNNVGLKVKISPDRGVTLIPGSDYFLKTDRRPIIFVAHRLGGIVVKSVGLTVLMF